MTHPLNSLFNDLIEANALKGVLLPSHSHDFTVPKHTHLLKFITPDHYHSIGRNAYSVEFLFEDENGAEIRNLGLFSDEAIAHSVAFDYAEEHINDEDLVALYITEFELNKVDSGEIIEEYYF